MDKSEDYIVMSIRKKKKEHEFKVAGMQLPLKAKGNTTTARIDSGSPIFIFTNGELRKMLEKRE